MNAVSKIKQLGWKYSFAMLFNRFVPQSLFRMRRFVIYRMQLPNQDAADSAHSTPAISIYRCESETEITGVEQTTYFRRSYSTGKTTAYGLKTEDQLAAGMWAATECFDEDELGVRIELSEQQTWLFAARVEKEFRRHGFYSQLLPFVMTDMAQQGFTDQLVSVNPDNLGSNRIHQRLSRETVGYVLAIRFSKMTCCWKWGMIGKDSTISWNSATKPIRIRLHSSDV